MPRRARPTVPPGTGTGDLLLLGPLCQCQLVRVFPFREVEAAEVIETVDGKGQGLRPSQKSKSLPNRRDS